MLSIKIHAKSFQRTHKTMVLTILKIALTSTTNLTRTVSPRVNKVIKKFFFAKLFNQVIRFLNASTAWNFSVLGTRDLDFFFFSNHSKDTLIFISKISSKIISWKCFSLISFTWTLVLFFSWNLYLILYIENLLQHFSGIW